MMRLSDMDTMDGVRGACGPPFASRPSLKAHSIVAATLFALSALFCSNSASACAMCMGASDAPIAPAVNGSIFLLLGVLLIVGGCFFRFVLYLARHDSLTADLEPPSSAEPTPSQPI